MLLQKIKERTATIGVIGLGYVGLPLVLEFSKAGFSVVGLDVDPEKVDLLTKGESYIRHIPSEKIAKLVKGGKFEATTDFSSVAKLDCALICVPTPLNHNREPDMSFIVSTARQMAPYLRKDQLIVLESDHVSRNHHRDSGPGTGRRERAKSQSGFFRGLLSPKGKTRTTSSIPPPRFPRFSVPTANWDWS